MTDAKFKTDLDEVKKLGGDGKTTPSARTDDQTEIALFWLESSPLKWSRIARTVATDKGLDMWESARLFAILDMALSDGYVAMSASKNHYKFWRPVTAISSGGDTYWTPLQPTPPNSDYPSGHSIEGGAGAEVLKQILGTDQISFQDCGATLPAGSTCYDRSRASVRHELLRGSGRERLLAYPRWIPLPQRNRRGNRIWSKIGERAATLLPPVK